MVKIGLWICIHTCRGSYHLGNNPLSHFQAWKSLATCEALWLCIIFSELGLPLDYTLDISVDNHSAISFAHNSGFHAHSKHIDIRHHLICENITTNKVQLKRTRPIFSQRGLTVASASILLKFLEWLETEGECCKFD